MKRVVVAIGGYSKTKIEERSFEPISINKEIIELSGKSNPKVLFIPTASTDSPKYIFEFQNMFDGVLNAQTDVLKLWDKNLNISEIKKKINNTDIIYVGGGNTLKMMNLWRRLGVEKMLINAYKKGIIMCGVSAGSICWFEAGVSDSRQYKNPDSHQYIRVTGLGILPYINNPHLNSTLYDRGFRTKGMQIILKRTKETCLAIEDAAAVVFINEEISKTLGSGKCFQVDSNGTYLKL
jgi:dipeptidase E